MSEKYKKYKFLGYCLVAIAIAPIVIANAVGFLSGCQIEIRGIPEVSNCPLETTNIIELLFIFSMYVGGFTLLPGLGLILVGAKVNPRHLESPVAQKMNIAVRVLWGFALLLLILWVLINAFKYFTL